MIMLRGSTLYLKRAVPKIYASVEPRRVVWASLKTDSRKEAQLRAVEVWRDLVAGWEAMLRGDSGNGETRYLAAQDLARARGFRFLPVERVAKLPLPDMVERIEATMRGGEIDMKLAAGILGTAAKPELTLSGALEAYWPMVVDQIEGKSEDQIRRWENPRKKAFKNLISVTGDVPLSEITAEDMLEFRDWWWRKLKKEGLTPNSANKDFTYIASTLRQVNKHKRLGLNLPVDGLAFSQGEKRTRLPFSETWIKEKLLAPGALDGLNLEARCILLGMINTGYRPSEAQELRAHHIRLDVNTPYITIEPEGRQLKTASSRRVIPLAGISLEAFRACPEGFPRYRSNPNLSATVNKFMRENKLCETPDHTLYGLRHSFEDRLLDRDTDERIRRDLMGHSLNRERYGKGASLEKLAAVVQSIAL